MFVIFKREKIMAYMISLSTVAVLLMFSVIVPEREGKESIEVSSNQSIQDNELDLNEKPQENQKN